MVPEVFDVLHLGGRDLTAWPYARRRAALDRLFTEAGLSVPFTLCPSATDPATACDWLTWTSAGIEGLCSRGARSILAAAPTPAVAAKLPRRRVQSLLKQAGASAVFSVKPNGSTRSLAATTSTSSPRPRLLSDSRLPLCSGSWTPHATTPTSSKKRARMPSSCIQMRRSAPVIRSFPGLAALTGARVLAEIGDDRAG